MSEYWEVIPEKSSDFILEIKDPEGWRSAQVKWDGCVHYYRYYNTPLGMNIENDDESDYIHLCDIDEEIARLQALKRTAYNYFEHQGRADHEWKPDIVDSTVVSPLQLEEKS